jgi:hypothetical protein
MNFLKEFSLWEVPDWPAILVIKIMNIPFEWVFAMIVPKVREVKYILDLSKSLNGFLSGDTLFEG